MSRLFEALSNLEPERRTPSVVPPGTPSSDEAPVIIGVHANRFKSSQEPVWDKVPTKPIDSAEERSIPVRALPESRLVALTAPNTLGAEKFRALVTRLDSLHKQHELKSFQVTSSVVNEGKSLVAGNVAVTLAKYSGSKTLLVEGDLHRPTLSALLGLTELQGISHWWSDKNLELAPFVHKLEGMPLWFLPAGKPCARPSDLLRSERFAKVFAQLASQFEWIVVDSTPMLPVVDVNLWSRLVDGTLLVVREGVAPIKALTKGLQALDHPRLIGVVMNEVLGSDHTDYEGQYYGSSNP
jgi:capsular exopolysaccharide synthesis family protein